MKPTPDNVSEFIFDALDHVGFHRYSYLESEFLQLHFKEFCVVMIILKPLDMVIKSIYPYKMTNSV